MHIIVCIKQVPDVTEVSWDPETGSLIRKGIPSIINPNDKNAIESALQLKERYGGEVIALSMGPSQVEEALREALGMGVDKAIQLTAKEFAGSDTWATAYTLGLAVKKTDAYDLIICGKEAVDGMTAQVGPQIAEYLNIPQATYVDKIEQLENNQITVTKRLENSHERLTIPLPTLLTVTHIPTTPRYPEMGNLIAACQEKAPIEICAYTF